jgi:hypothetical protein
MVLSQSVFIQYSEYQRLKACEKRVIQLDKEKQHHSQRGGGAVGSTEAGHMVGGGGGGEGEGGGGGGGGRPGGPVVEGNIVGLPKSLQASLPPRLNLSCLPPLADPVVYESIFPDTTADILKQNKLEAKEKKNPLPAQVPLDAAFSPSGPSGEHLAAQQHWYYNGPLDKYRDEEEEDYSRMT